MDQRRRAVTPSDDPRRRQGAGGPSSEQRQRRSSLEPRAPARRRSAASRDILSSWSVDAEARCPAQRRVGTGFARAAGVRRSDALLLWLSLCSLRRRASFPASLCLWCLVLCTHMQRMGWEAARDACQGVGRGVSHAGGLSRAVWHEVVPCIIQILSLGHRLAGRGGVANECAYWHIGTYKN